MKILIFGASGTGTTTLGRSLAENLGYTFLDVDDYYWKPTNPPFQEKIPLAERNKSLEDDYHASANVIISGSLVTWGDFWSTAFDLAIFLWLPPNIRLHRLQKREEDRYGKQLYENKNLKKKSHAFLNWAAQYDDPTFKGRSIKQHEDWIKILGGQVLQLRGDLTNEERIAKVLKHTNK